MSSGTRRESLARRRVREFVGAYRKNTQAMIGLGLLVFVLLVACLAPVFAPYDPDALIGNLLEAPSKAHPFGTDNLGRDVFSRIIYGTRISLIIGTVAAMLSGVLGTSMGAIAGYFGGRTDVFLSQVIDVVLMIPSFFLILIVVALLGSSMVHVMVVIGLTSWPGNARLMRAQALSLRARTFVLAARASGESEWQILLRYIIPNGIFPVVSNTTMQVAAAILTEASLSFLGLGDPNVVSWGQMIFSGRTYITSAWWVAALPGLAIVITVAAFYMIGDGLNQVLNPILRS